MPYDVNIFQQDLKAVKNSLEKDDFDNLNIFANRVMSNSYIFNDLEKMICGFMLKDLALILLPLEQVKSSKSKSTAKALAAGFFKKIYDQSKDQISTENLWSEYYKFSNAVRVNTLTEHEDVAYSGENNEFTHEAVKILLTKLEEKKNNLLNPSSLLLNGILNEIIRLYKVHGGQLSDEFAYALIAALERCHNYITAILGNTETFEEEVNSKIIPEIQKITEIMKKVEENGGKWIREIDEKIFQLSKQWREYFVLYMEYGKTAKERVIRIPDESRKKLTEAIARSLEEELPRKNR